METYPELEKIAQEIAEETAKQINKKALNVQSKMPYKAKYVLEEVIKILQEAV